MYKKRKQYCEVTGRLRMAYFLEGQPVDDYLTSPEIMAKTGLSRSAVTRRVEVGFPWWVAPHDRGSRKPYQIDGGFLDGLVRTMVEIRRETCGLPVHYIHKHSEHVDDRIVLRLQDALNDAYRNGWFEDYTPDKNESKSPAVKPKGTHDNDCVSAYNAAKWR